MSVLPVSVVIVSRGRPDALKRCLTGISQLQYASFEVVVVADPEGVTAAKSLPFWDDLKLVPFDIPNISLARNLGLAHAAGEVVAFIDDDAVPRPGWLHHLVSPAERPKVAAMGGYVRGRNGISFQWKAQSLDGAGVAHPMEIDAVRPTLLTPPYGRAVKTEGTNMAFRRDILIELGGFDPAFHYYLDETDLNMRLARAGHATALVPLAEVHHGFAANRIRSATRVPKDLFDIGASWAVFQRKHIDKHGHRDHWKARRSEQRRRLLEHMVRGTLDPGDIGPLMERLDLGYGEGQSRPIADGQLPTHPVAPFRPFPGQERPYVFLPCRLTSARKTRAEAVARVVAGENVTLLVLSPTALYHYVKFTDEGLWEQHGGIFGKSERNQPLFQATTLSGRSRKEELRMAQSCSFSALHNAKKG